MNDPIGTVWHLAEMAGVGVKKLSFTPITPSHVHVPCNGAGNPGNGKDDASVGKTTQTPLCGKAPQMLLADEARQEAMEVTHRNGITESTFDTVPKRMAEKGLDRVHCQRPLPVLLACTCEGRRGVKESFAMPLVMIKKQLGALWGTL